MGWEENMGEGRAGMLAEARPREAVEWQKQARGALANGDYETARTCYMKCVESWKQGNKLNGGIYLTQWEEATREYELFVEKDPTFTRLFGEVKPVIEASPGVLQTELYKMLPGIDRSDISYVLYFAAKQGKILRKKKGRTYEVSLL